MPRFEKKRAAQSRRCPSLPFACNPNLASFWLSKHAPARYLLFCLGVEWPLLPVVPFLWPFLDLGFPNFHGNVAPFMAVFHWTFSQFPHFHVVSMAIARLLKWARYLLGGDRRRYQPQPLGPRRRIRSLVPVGSKERTRKMPKQLPQCGARFSGFGLLCFQFWTPLGIPKWGLAHARRNTRTCFVKAPKSHVNQGGRMLAACCC